MSVKIISVMHQLDEQVLLNHRHYAGLYGYAHQWVETAAYAHDKLKVAYKYNYILQQLKALPEGELLMVLDGHSVVVQPIDVAGLMHGRDSLVFQGPSEANAADIVMTNLLLLRNTAGNRTFLHEMLIALHGTLATQDWPCEEELLQKFTVFGNNTTWGEVLLNADWRVVGWYNMKIFVLFVGATGSWREGRVSHNEVRQMTHDANLEQVLVQQVNGYLLDGQPLMVAPNYPALSNDAVSHFNPSAKIALVSLYTHHISRYARISEHNVKRYCDRHGYAYHVYRQIPDDVPDNVMGSWLKPKVLLNHFADYDWVIWVDADVLFRNQSLPLEPILAERELLLAKDLCAWTVNSGVLGFKNTPVNAQLLQRLQQRMDEVHDKSTVYSEQGDQFHIICVLDELALVNEHNVSNCLTINTAPPMSTNDTLLTHYVGLSEPNRSIYMAHDDALSQRVYG
ncbi:MAG: galactosyl transferase GMA12/MNN10 family protein [Formosimonas sp.]